MLPPAGLRAVAASQQVGVCFVTTREDTRGSRGTAEARAPAEREAGTNIKRRLLSSIINCYNKYNKSHNYI
jgi:hypothetical protein